MFSIAGLLEAPLKIVHVGASMVPDMPEAYAPLVAAGGAKVICFEPNAAECEKLRVAMGPAYTVLPHFIGAGGPATFHETNNPFTGSLLEPNAEVLSQFNFLPELMRAVRQHQVTTTRLDDIAELADADYLKIDIQGAELDAFRAGQKLLDSCVLVETEAEFVQLYKGQPLFADVDLHLRGAGFGFHTFRNTCGRYFRPMKPQGPPNVMLNQLLWTDAVYVRHLLNLERLSTSKLISLAVLLHDVYGSFDVTLAALRTADQRDGSKRANAYFSQLSAAIAPPA